MKIPYFAKEFLKPTIIQQKPHVIVVKKVVQPSLNMDSLIQDILEIHQIEKRRKERQRIKRKKANKRRLQKQIWNKRFYSSFHH